jgi:hypothetical protein
MEKMQSYINFIFYQVWCRARKAGNYRIDLFDSNPALKKIMEEFHFSDTKYAYFFTSHVERIYGLFFALSRDEVSQLKRWYQGNNCIREACDNTQFQIVRYEEVIKKHADLGNLLKSFFSKLYDNIDNSILKQRIGTIDDHYDNFTKVNTVGKCPFCGIADIHGAYHSTREAYDHYLPKTYYPFNSINFRNLAPACHHCNSSYKTTKDPTHIPKDRINPIRRRKAFYPYSQRTYTVVISFEIKSCDFLHLKPTDLSIKFGPVEFSEELETWNDVYGIEERYKAKICSENGGIYWVEQILGEWKENGKNPAEYMITLTRNASRKPYAENNFLKKPFLEACGNAGLFNDDQLAPSMAPAEKTGKF